MWEVLEVTHEGTNDMKRARKHALIQEYELFKMQQGKSIAEVQNKFTHIINHLIGLGKEFDKKELNIKVLKCLDRPWQPKVTTILGLELEQHLEFYKYKACLCHFYANFCKSF